MCQVSLPTHLVARHQGVLPSIKTRRLRFKTIWGYLISQLTRFLKASYCIFMSLHQKLHRRRSCAIHCQKHLHLLWLLSSTVGIVPSGADAVLFVRTGAMTRLYGSENFKEKQTGDVSWSIRLRSVPKVIPEIWIVLQGLERTLALYKK